MIGQALLLATDAVFSGAQISVVALGFAVVYRTTRHMHFAYAAIWTFCAYAFGSCIERGWPVSAAFAGTFVLACALSLACLFFYRRVRTEFALVPASFGLYLALLGVQLIVWGPSPLGIVQDSLIGRTAVLAVGGQRLPVPLVYVAHLLVVTFAALALAWALGRTRTGRSALAVSENRDLSVVTGIQVGRVETAAYILSALLVATSASVQVSAVGSDVQSGTELFIEALIVVIVAGPVVVKVVLAALLFGLVRSAAQMALGTEFVVLVTHLVLLGLIAFRPAGLFSTDFVFTAADRRASRVTPPRGANPVSK